MLLYPPGVERSDLVAVVYLGHHYFIDVAAGILFAVGAYAAVQSPFFLRLAQRLASPFIRRRAGGSTPSSDRPRGRSLG